MGDTTIAVPTLCHCALPAPPSFSPVAANGTPPSTHPEAARLVVVAAKVLYSIYDASGYGSLVSGPLRLDYWPCLAPHIQAGYGVWWHGRIVLLTAREEAWLYHPGDDWEAALRQAAAESANNAASTE